MTIGRAIFLAAAAAALVAGCGSGDRSTVASVNTLRFTRADGSRITFRGPVSVTCERAEGDKAPLLRVVVGRRLTEGTRPFLDPRSRAGRSEAPAGAGRPHGARERVVRVRGV